jgi:hypothetical protein
MKILVYNHYDQYALSRKEIELLVDLLPKEYWARISVLHLAHSHYKKAEPFEYDEKTKVGYLIMPVKEKTAELRNVAIRELLLGLIRIKAKSRFFLPMKSIEREEYKAFVEEWLPRCEAVLASSNH